MSVIELEPSEKQLELLRCTARNVAYGGARGGGKSWGCDLKAAILGGANPGIKLLIVRKTYKDLERNHIRPLKPLLKGLAKYNKQEHVFYFYNGSILECGYCDNDGDAEQYQGVEYDVILIDEATQMSEYQLDCITACCRGVNSFPKRIYYFCNPGGQGHAYIKRLFVDRGFKTGENPEDYVFIQSKVTDNKALMESDPGYYQRLLRLPYALREAWLNGSWDIFAGQYFSEWDREVHVAAPPRDIPPHWRRYVTIDYGLDMLAGYLIDVDERGNAYVEREVYEGRDLGEGAVGLIISQAAERLLDMVNGDKVDLWLAPPDLWNARQETGKSFADIFAECGIYLTQTSNDRLDGWMAMHEWLHVDTDESGAKRAKLRISPGCVNLIRTLPQLCYDQRRVNDVAIEPHELTHAADAIRGFCVYWIESAYPPGAAPKQGKLIDRYKRGRHRR